jgi:Tfp pilus assembly protein PilX
MISYKVSRKGVALFMVLATILIVVVLANVVLTIISNQARLTRHEVGRIQAYYGAQAGLIYTMEKIRTGTAPAWPFSSASDRYYCFAISSGLGALGKCIDAAAPDPCPLIDTIPYDEAVTRSGAYKVQVKVYANPNHPLPPPNGYITLDSKVDYTYTP